MQGIEPCVSRSRTVRVTDAPHPELFDFRVILYNSLMKDCNVEISYVPCSSFVNGECGALENQSPVGQANGENLEVFLKGEDNYHLGLYERAFSQGGRYFGRCALCQPILIAVKEEKLRRQ